jgi:Sec-independent protein translocase protein TatA
VDGFLDIGYPEIIMILVVIPLAVGPEKLLEYARKLGNTIHNFRI